MNIQQQKDLWKNLHECYSIVKTASIALHYEDSKNTAAYAVSLELTSEKIMQSIHLLDDQLASFTN
jgi:hypothetical protein